MKTKLIALGLALLIGVNIVGCSAPAGNQQGKPEEMQTTATQTRSFTDDCGRQVEIPQDIQRVVPSGPVAQMMLLSIAPEKMVGVAARWPSAAQGILSEDLLQLPRFGQLYGSADLNVEELALAQPQLIVDVGEPKDNIAQDLDALQTQINIPTVYISATLETSADTFRKLGDLLGAEEKAEQLAQFCQRVYDRTKKIMEQVGDNKVNALYVLGEAGLNVLAKGSYHADILDLLTNNLAIVDNPASKGSGNEVTLEQIALWNPDLILFAPDSIYADVKGRDTWKDINAIAKSRYLQVPEGPYNWMGSPPSVQRYLALIWLPAQLYPQYCDYDVQEEVTEFYRLFYGCDLSQEKYDALVAHSFFP